jgi:hypothetical protein
MAEWKKVIVSGSNAELNRIFASGAITGSNISSSGDLFASLVTASTTNVVTYNTTTGKFHYTASNNVGTNTIGTPDDGNYNDGLFPFTPSTTIATAVDDINEVLAGLAPPAAPALDYIDATGWTTIADWESGNYYLAFGASTPTSSYSPVSSGSTTGFSDVEFANIYTGSAGVTGTVTTSRIRLGVLTLNTTPITVTLNNDVAANIASFTNYPADAFKATADTSQGETYTIDINGTTYTYTTTTSASVTNVATTPPGPTITLTAAQTGSFTGTGQSFSLFRHRTGTVSIPASTWRTGSNFARVSSSIAGGPTTYIDWVFDPAAAAGNFPYIFNNFRTASISTSGIKWISGIPYLTSFAFTATGSVSNYYKNSYSLNSFTPTVTIGGSMGPVTPSNPTTADSLLQVSTAYTSTTNRILSQSLTTTITISHPFSSKSNNTAVSTSAILYDNVASSGITGLVENFTSESRRVPSASYNNQNSANTAIGTYPASESLNGRTSELMVFSGSLRYPTASLNGGNFTGIFHTASATTPNYTGINNNRYYYRVFTNGSSDKGNFALSVTGINTTWIPYTGNLSGSNNIKISAKIPGLTGWRDLMTGAPGGSYTPLDDNVGCQTGAAPSNLGATYNTTTFNITFLTELVPANGFLVLRLEASSSWRGNLTNLTLA